MKFEHVIGPWGTQLTLRGDDYYYRYWGVMTRNTWSVLPENTGSLRPVKVLARCPCGGGVYELRS